MPQPAPRSAKPRRTRRWRVPPPLTRGSELMEGTDVLTELSGDTAVLIWKSLRNVTLWANTAPRERAALFAEGARERRMAELLAVELDAALQEPLADIAALLDDPSHVRREALALACRRIAQWADARGAAGTTLAFVQAAALVCPADAALALEVGRLARQRAENARSESWFRRAIMLGRQSDDWHSYTLAFLGLGNLFIQRGNFPAALRAHIKGYRAARRHGLQEVQAFARHGLFVIAVEAGDVSAAHEHARAALRAYGRGHPRVPALAHDLAGLWMMQGDFARALPIFRAVLNHIDRAEERMVVWANVARAAGATGDRHAFGEAWDHVLAPAEADEAQGVAQASLNLARGALSLGEWDRAQAAGARALDCATRRGEAQIRIEAEALLEAVQADRASATAPEHHDAATAAGNPEADALATDLLVCLAADAPVA